MNCIWLASYPKSGNTWLRFFLYSYYFGEPRKSSDINKRIPDIHSNPSFDQAGEDVVFCKTHFLRSKQHPYNVATQASIYIIRHPRDVLLSNLNYFRMTGHLNIDPVEFARQFIRQRGVEFWRKAGMGSWPEHARSWLSQREEPGLLLRYEDMRQDPRRSFSEVIRFFGEEVDEKKMSFALYRSSFDSMKRLESREKRKNKYGDVFWGNAATSRQGLYFINTGGVSQSLESIAAGLDREFDDAFSSELLTYGYK